MSYKLYSTKRILLLSVVKINLLLLSVLLSMGSVSAQTFPSDRWTYSDFPYEDGWGIEKSTEFNRYLIDSTHITGFVIVHKGKIVFKYGDIEENSYIGMCRQSILAMLFGQHVENEIINLDKTLEELEIDEIDGLLTNEKRATVRNLLEGKSGIYHPDGYTLQTQEYAPERNSVAPGTEWLFSNWNIDVAGFIFEQQLGKTIYQEVNRQLAGPLNMQDWDMALQNKAGDISISKHQAFPMWFSTRDMARIGLLMLNKGNWRGEQLIPENWVHEMLTVRATSEEVNTNFPFFNNLDASFGYGYMWWLWENSDDYRLKDAFITIGSMGQSIAVYPGIETVVAYKTKDKYWRNNSKKIRIDLLKKAVGIYQLEENR